MLDQGARKFELYDFFSVLIPGSAFALVILPFAPESLPVFSTASILMFLLAGFIFGRLIHAMGLLMETPLDEDTELGGIIDIRQGQVATGHRDFFKNELLSPDKLSPGLVNEFYELATDHFSGLDLPAKRENLEAPKHEDEIETLYTLVRSFVHLDSRGRSRSFQAVLDFQRTTMVASFIAFFIYFGYGTLLTFEVIPEGIVGYQSYIGSLDIQTWVILYGAAIFFGISYTMFQRVRSNYRLYFIQYLMSDFVNLLRA